MRPSTMIGFGVAMYTIGITIMGFGLGRLNTQPREVTLNSLKVEKILSYSDGINSTEFEAVGYATFDDKPYIHIESRSKSNLIFVTNDRVQNYYLYPGGKVMLPKFEKFGVIKVSKP
jgi:hypothetical protein